MPFPFILAIILAVLAAAVGITWKVASPPPDPAPRRGAYDDPPFPLRRAAGLAAIVLGALTALMLLAASWTQVTTQNIGIITSFGKPTGHLSNGLHFTAPWVNVTEMDGSIQTDSYTGGNCVDVRIGSQQTACVNVSIRWRINPAAADLLFRNYHDFNGVRDSLVTRELATALNQQFSIYNPVASLTSTIPAGHPGNPTVAQLAGRVAAQMRREIGSQIEVDNVLIPLITYDTTTQARINSVLAQTAQTDIAQQAIKTAQAQAAANADLAHSAASLSPDVLEQNCLNLVNEAIKANYTLPPGFSCFGGSSVGVIASGH